MFPIVFILKVAFIFYSVFVAVLLFILRLVEKYFKRNGDKDSYVLCRRIGFLLGMSVILGIVIWIDAFVIEPNWIQVTRLEIKSPHFNEQLKDIKIVQITDLHIEQIGLREKSMIRLINNLKPDVILTNGDFINSKEGWQPALGVLSQLRAKTEIYTILGNTDYYFPLEEGGRFTELERTGVHILFHENLRLDFGERGYFWLAGLSDKFGLKAQYGETKYIDQAFEGIPMDEPKVLLVHDPQHALVKQISTYKPDLILAGDTHGGQVGISFLRQFSDYANRGDYMAGLFHIHRNIPLYVNRGIGMKTINIRLLCRPEITVIKLIKG